MQKTRKHADSTSRARKPRADAAAPVLDVIVVGTGFAGLGMAIKLLEDGCRDFVLLERGDSVGGTWRDNHYPGAACDVPSHLYSFSFAPKSDWSRKYPSQPELHAYLRDVAAHHGLLPYIRLHTTLRSAAYDEAAQLWRVQVTHADGTPDTLCSRTLVMGNGGLAEPRWPQIDGLQHFRGHRFHSAQWDHGYALAGKRVAVIGTGASATQFVPEIARVCAQLDVYQRTPGWVVPRLDRAYSAVEKNAFRLPALRKLYRSGIYWSHEARVVGMVLQPALMKLYQKLAKGLIRQQVKDPQLRAKVTPDYLIGCKRVLVSSDWYPALARSNVQLITEGIREVREHAVVCDDGSVREVDCIIFATGFHATENPIGAQVRGRGGVALAQAWRDGEEAYLGTLVKHFPNLFLLVGPNTGVGHTSMVYIIESQIALIRRLVARLRAAGGGAIEVRASVQDRFNRELQRRLGTSVWASGCRSWYRHRSGKITALWPGFTFMFRRALQQVSAADYIMEAPRAP